MQTSHKIQYYFLLFLSKVFMVFGAKSPEIFSKIFAFLGYIIFGIRKSVVIGNLEQAFPEYSKQEIDDLAYRNYKSIFKTFLEVMYIPKMNKEIVKHSMDCDNLELIKQKHAEGRGVILLTAHFGNWELGAISAGAQLNTSIAVLVREQSNQYISGWMNSIREVLGNKAVLAGASVREIYKSLREGKIVGMVGDQRGPEDARRVKFMGQDTSVYPGTAAIALKLKTPIITIISERQKDNSYKAYIKEIPFDDLEGSDEEKISQINQMYMSILENRIWQAPEQWFWMHKIWKH